MATPDANSTDDQKAAFQRVLTDYELAQQSVDATPFSPKYQSYVDIINDPATTDQQKLQAYTSFKIDSALEHGQTHQAGSSAVDFKFDWLTRDSDFLVRAHQNDRQLTAFYERETAATKAISGRLTDLNQSLAGRIDVISNFTQVQQQVAIVDTLYDKLSWGLACSWDSNASLAGQRNQNALREPNFRASAGYAADPNTVIAQSFASALKALHSSHVGSSFDPKDQAFIQLFTTITADFGQRAAERA